MIPKKIHYCWFGNKPLPKDAQRCIASWRKYLPDYEIIEWNERNFDVNEIPYTLEAYRAGKYAFVSDYVRFKILYLHGGIYFDTDVEVIRPLDEILLNGSFMGCELSPTDSNHTIKVAAGLGLGAEANHPLYAEIMQQYQSKHFLLENGKKDLTTVVDIVTDILRAHNLQTTAEIQKIENISIYPKEYFCPINYDGKMQITSNTYTIHHYAQSWQSPVHVWARNIIIKIGGKWLRNRIAQIYGRHKSSVTKNHD